MVNFFIKWLHAVVDYRMYARISIEVFVVVLLENNKGKPMILRLAHNSLFV